MFSPNVTYHSISLWFYSLTVCSLSSSSCVASTIHIISATERLKMRLRLSLGVKKLYNIPPNEVVIFPSIFCCCMYLNLEIKYWPALIWGLIFLVCSSWLGAKFKIRDPREMQEPLLYSRYIFLLLFSPWSLIKVLSLIIADQVVSCILNHTMLCPLCQRSWDLHLTSNFYVFLVWTQLISIPFWFFIISICKCCKNVFSSSVYP